MRTTLILDPALLAEAGRYTGETRKTRLVHMGLELLVQREAAKRLARLRGAMPDLQAPKRRRSTPAR
jgi:hypothetical protein